jgi:hypothetical protein
LQKGITVCSVKQQLKEIVEAVGFENWRDSRIAEFLLDDHNSDAKRLYDNRYLLMGFHEGYFVYVHIEWIDGCQPRVHRVESEHIQ